MMQVTPHDAQPAPRHAAFLHSTGMGAFMWRPLAERLPPGWTLHTPGNTGYPPGPLLPRGEVVSLDDEVDTVLRQLPAGIELHLGGHSYGALVAMKIALSGRVRVKSLWLYEPVMYGALRQRESQLPPDVTAQVAQLFDHPAYRTLDVDNGGNDSWLQGFIEHWNGDGAWAAMPEKLKVMTRAVGWKMYLEVRGQAADTATFEDHRFDIPLTIVAGERTTPAAMAIAQALAAANPGSRFEVLAGHGHMAPATAFDAVAPSIARHLAWAAEAE